MWGRAACGLGLVLQGSGGGVDLHRGAETVSNPNPARRTLDAADVPDVAHKQTIFCLPGHAGTVTRLSESHRLVLSFFVNPTGASGTSAGS